MKKAADIDWFDVRCKCSHRLGAHIYASTVTNTAGSCDKCDCTSFDLDVDNRAHWRQVKLLRERGLVSDHP